MAVVSPAALAASVASVTNRSEMSTPTTSIPRSARARAWRPGPQPTSSTREPGSQPEPVDQELHLVAGAPGERVAEVGGAEVVGERLEPVIRAQGPHTHVGGIHSQCFAPLPHLSPLDTNIRPT